MPESETGEGHGGHQPHNWALTFATPSRIESLACELKTVRRITSLLRCRTQRYVRLRDQLSSALSWARRKTMREHIVASAHLPDDFVLVPIMDLLVTAPFREELVCPSQIEAFKPLSLAPLSHPLMLRVGFVRQRLQEALESSFASDVVGRSVALALCAHGIA